MKEHRIKIIDTLYFGDVASKIRDAHHLFRVHGRSLLENPEVAGSIEELDRLDESLKGLMRAMGMVEECAECGRQFQGGCCSDEMADETYALLLLIGLLAGGEVREWESGGPGCRFLGPSGCVLKFKPFICLNFKCRKMSARHSPQQRSALEDATSALLNHIATLEELLCRELESGQGE